MGQNHDVKRTMVLWSHLISPMWICLDSNFITKMCISYCIIYIKCKDVINQTSCNMAPICLCFLIAIVNILWTVKGKAMHLAWDWKSSAICDGQAFGRKQGVIQEKTLYYYFIHYYKKNVFGYHKRTVPILLQDITQITSWVFHSEHYPNHCIACLHRFVFICWMFNDMSSAWILRRYSKLKLLFCVT